jgi:hypothetical protein
MKTRIAVLTSGSLTVLVAAVLLASASPAHQAHAAGGGCLASYAGGFFGFSGDGFGLSATAPAAPRAVAGEIFLTADSSTSLTGFISGFATFNNHGSITRVTLGGTYAMVSGECMGSLIMTRSIGSTLHYDLVPTGWSLGGTAKEVLFVETDPQTTGTLDAISM